MVLYVVRDLLFVSKIRETAEPLGVAVQGVRDVETLPDAAKAAKLVVLDLALPQAMRALELLAAHPETRRSRASGSSGMSGATSWRRRRRSGAGR